MITEKDIEIIKYNEGMLDILAYKPGKYSVPDDKLEEELMNTGMLDMYNKWDKFLRENGFKFTYPLPINLRKGSIIYVKETDLSVTGDHSQDCVILYAYLTAEKVMFVYDSSKLNYHYSPHGFDDDAGLRRFYEKNYDYINYYPDTHKIEIVKIEGVTYFVSEESEMVYYRFDDFARLAIILDYEMNKRFPFHTRSEYELAEQEYLKRTLTDEAGFVHPGFGEFSSSCILGTIVGTSYSATREDSLARAKEILYSLSENNEELKEYIVEAVCKLETMSDEEYGVLRDKVFDIR